MGRISRVEMFMDVAKVVSKRATCFRLNVGAVVTIDNRIVSHGWNGQAPGEPHCTGHSCPGADGCKETIHAEVNALQHVPKAIGLLMKDVYVTDSPCLDCAMVIAKSRVKRVFYSTPYRDTSGLDWLSRQGVSCYRVLPGGYVIDWDTKRTLDPETL